MQNKEKVAGVRMSTLNNVMIIIVIAVSVLLLYATAETLKGYHSLNNSTERYIACQQSAQMFQEGSDCLTNEARYFATTGDPAHAWAFDEEIVTTRRRDQAIEVLAEVLQEDASYDYLKEAKAHSDALAEVECYAMRLMADAWGLSLDALPQRVGGLALTEEDAALSNEEKRAAGLDMLFGESYTQSKGEINDNVGQSIQVLIDETRQDQQESARHLEGLLRRQRAMIALLVVQLFALVVLTYGMVILPMRKAVEHIRANAEIPVRGAYEMRFLAQTYNDIFEQQNRSREKLTYSATHDALTGLYNRAAYESFYHTVDQAEIGLLIIDVDKFKQFNDTYGHDVGDQVLKRVAQVLRESFRSEDFVARIGGDEFCVIMRRVDSRMRRLVEDKIAAANHRLQNPEDDLPKISLSVGVAFGDRENPVGDIFKDADTALYRIKRGGRGRCGVYGPEDSQEGGA